ncbi:alpha/beta fold hydrolase [Bacillaceae bacterium W0354]
MERETKVYTINGLDIEYSVVGAGEPIIVFHGGHSNSNEEFGYRALVENGYSIITPSRAGYGRTSIELGESLAKACQYYALLLDELRVEQAHVIAISAGGPTGICFASSFPEKVKSLTLESAVTKEWLTPKDMEYKAAHIIFRPSVERFTWGMLSNLSNFSPKLVFKMMASQFSSLPRKVLKQKTDDSDVFEFKKMINRQRSGHGFLIDIKQSKGFTVKDLNSITSPTLILHSNNDGFIPIEHPNYAYENINHSNLSLLDSWGHLIWLGKHSNERDRKLLSFIKEHKINVEYI